MPNAKAGEVMPEDCRTCTHWDRVEQRMRVRELLTSMVDKLESRIEGDDFKASVGDFLKVLEIDKEMRGPDEAGEMTVRWEDAGEIRRN